MSGKAFIYDGDSIFFGKAEIRLDAIDAPEKAQACRDKRGAFWPCGIAARDALRQLVGASYVQCVIGGKDKYKRLLGTCYAGKDNLNAAMVQKGYAVAYHYFSETYTPQEKQAKASQAGIWQDAAFTEPYYCRHFTSGHSCYEYDFRERSGKLASMPLAGRFHAIGAPD